MSRPRPKRHWIEDQPPYSRAILAPYLNDAGGQMMDSIGIRTEASPYPGDRTRLPILVARLRCSRRHVIGFLVEGGSHPHVLYETSIPPDEVLRRDPVFNEHRDGRLLPSDRESHHAIRLLRPGVTGSPVRCPRCKQDFSFDGERMLADLAARRVELELSVHVTRVDGDN